MNACSIVLHVEDNADHAELVRRALVKGMPGIELHRVRDGVEALEFLRREGEFAGGSPRPDLVLLDLRLPRVDGFGVLESIRSDSALHELPVVVFSTSPSELDSARAQELGADEYLVKPSDFPGFRELVTVIERLRLARPERTRRESA